MDDFDLLSLFTEEVVQSHKQIEKEDEPHYEEPSPSLYGPIYSPFRVTNDSYTTY